MNLEKSKELFTRANLSLVGGVNSPVRAFQSVGGNPIFIDHAKGSKIYDTDNNEYIDYVGSYGPMILGHGHPEVLKAVQAATENGFSFGATTEAEVVLAELIKSSIKSIDKIRFVNSGTEATMSAIRLARGYTKRNKVIKFAGCYHGHEDNMLVAAGSGVVTHGLPGSEGVPEAVVQDTLVAVYNDLESVESLFNQFKEEIAAIIIEPVTGNMGVVLPKDGFLEGIQKLTLANGALLIVDEVMTGYRSHFGAAHELLGVSADIVCLGKVIGGGMPVGAYGGKQEVMSCVAPEGKVYQAGTLSGNPIAMAAGIATLTALKNANPYEKFKKTCESISAEVTAEANKLGIPVQVNFFGSMINLFFSDQTVTNFEMAQSCDTEKFTKFFWGIMEKGLYIPPSQFESWFLSDAHSQADIEHTITIIKKVLQTL